MLARKFLNQPVFGVAQSFSKVQFGKHNQCSFSSSVVPSSSQNQLKSAESASNRQPSSGKGDADLPVWDMPSPFKVYKQECILCRMNIHPNYKNVKLLSQFVSRFTGKVYGRHITRLCRKQQTAVENEIGKAQTAGLMPYYFRDLDFTDDPKLFNPERPVRPHRF